MTRIIFTPTGEVRPPKWGEWYCDSGYFLPALNKHLRSYPIYIRTEEEMEECPR